MKSHDVKWDTNALWVIGPADFLWVFLSSLQPLEYFNGCVEAWPLRSIVFMDRSLKRTTDRFNYPSTGEQTSAWADFSNSRTLVIHDSKWYSWSFPPSPPIRVHFDKKDPMEERKKSLTSVSFLCLIRSGDAPQARAYNSWVDIFSIWPIVSDIDTVWKEATWFDSSRANYPYICIFDVLSSFLDHPPLSIPPQRYRPGWKSRNSRIFVVEHEMQYLQRRMYDRRLAVANFYRHFSNSVGSASFITMVCLVTTSDPYILTYDYYTSHLCPK